MIDSLVAKSGLQILQVTYQSFCGDCGDALHLDEAASLLANTSFTLQIEF